MNFNTLCQKLIDAWLAHENQGNVTPDMIYADVLASISVRSRLAVVNVESEDAGEWLLQTIRNYKLPGRMPNFNAFISDGRLSAIKDQAYLEKSVYPSYRRAVEQRVPVIDSVEARIAGIKVVYDRIILPQKGPERPRWLIIYTYGRFMAHVPERVFDLDGTDEEIVIALINGLTSKEIAIQVNLSHRTIEHRIERMKKRFEARSLPHLTALLVSAGFDKAIRHQD